MNQASRSTPWKILMRTFVQERESQANDVNSSLSIHDYEQECKLSQGKGNNY
jgi:hypothetical protein